MSWATTYAASVVRQVPELLEYRCNSGAIATIQTARSDLEGSLKFFVKTEGPDRDPTWLQSLPSEALRLFMTHLLDLAQGWCRTEISGALKQSKAQRLSLIHI